MLKSEKTGKKQLITKQVEVIGNKWNWKYAKINEKAGTNSFSDFPPSTDTAIEIRQPKFQ